MRRPVVLLALVLLAGCNSLEKRMGDASPSLSRPGGGPRESELVAGPLVPLAEVKNPFESNQQAINEGQRLYRWLNCVGCHANGGGAIGPPLIDDRWIYGSKPANLYESIVKGRPNGMPSFAGKLPEYQVWQIVSYLQAMPNRVPPKEPDERP